MKLTFRSRLAGIVAATACLSVLTTAWAPAADRLELGIEEVISTAISNNLDLQVEKLKPGISENTVISEESVFDPVFFTDISGSTRNEEKILSDVDTTGYEVGGEVSKKFTPGTDVSLSLEYSEDEVDAIDGTGEGSSTLTTLVVRQPLLKNRGRDVNLRSLSLAENDLKISRLALTQAVIDTVSQAQRLYWQYYYTLAFLDVQRTSLNLAKESLEDMEERVRLGSSARLDLLSSKAEVASREGAVIDAENDVYNSRDALLNYIYSTIPSDVEVVCTDKPDFVELTLDETTLLDYAMLHRADYLTQQINVRSAETDVVYFANQRLPQLDISGIVGVNSGDSDNETIQQLQSDDYQDYQYGMVTLSLEYPFGQRRDSANYASTLLRKRQEVASLEQLRTEVGLEVRTAMRDMRTAHQRYQAALVASEYAKESLKTEQEKLANGLSTSYQVLLKQRDLTDAKSTEVEAMVQFQITVINLHRAVGSTLEQHHIEFDEQS